MKPSGPHRASRFELHRATPVPLIAALLVLAATPALSAPDPGSTREASEQDSQGRYLVVFDGSVDRVGEMVAEHERRYGAEITHIFRNALRGYAARVPEHAVSGIARDPRVAFIEQDQVVEAFAQVIPTGIGRISAPNNTGLDIDGIDDLRADVDIAILDTGIDLAHPDLNVVGTANCIGTGSVGYCVEGSAGQDDNGHGTHVAGTAAALDNGIGVVGVAPGARLHAVKVLTASGDGLVSDVIAGIDWVTARADTIEIANMSLGCRCTVAALDQALSASASRGVMYAVAAGNADIDVREYSPAGHPDVLTVSGLADFDGLSGGQASSTCRDDRDDTLAEFSNWGSLVNVAAPGTCILSTFVGGLYATGSGTSMASPHVAGAAAILASGANDPQDASDVAAIRQTIIGAGNANWVDDSGDGLQEPLLDVGNGEIFVVNSPTRTLQSPPPPPSGNEAPIATFSHSCAELSCSFDASGSYDPDGTISNYAWDFGDGTTGSGSQVSKRYEASGSYTVTLTVTDDHGLTGSASAGVTVSSGSGNGNSETFRLTVGGTRINSRAVIDLRWGGTDRVGLVVLYRDGTIVATTEDDGSYMEVIENSSGSYTYKVCEEGTARCSNEARVF